MKLRKTMLTVATLAVTAASALTITGTAAATTDPSGGAWNHVFTSHDRTARIYVQEYNDVIKACDISANGKPVSLDVYIGKKSFDPRYSVTVKGDKGKCVTHSASQGGKYNLPKGRTILLEFSGNGPGSHNVTGAVFTSR
ncbi:hypothetical protein [Amycolatopsis granulosa]|uniref:hypothetical protein n=1 Tax=Amycolatopsis granulosa TaxID=185684 RepID=UPI001420902F|nr:hypothetical protein [Amycolatopsis granulosa]